MKKCSRCGIEKDESEFCKSKRDGYTSDCKICRRALAKEYQQKNNDKIRARKKKWLEENGEDYRARQREYANKRYNDNLERERERCRDWRKSNPEVYKKSNKKSCKKRYENNKEWYLEQSKKWKLKNPEKVKALARKHSKVNKKRYPEKERARMFVSMAIKTRLLVRPKNCTRCSVEGKIEGHHTDYNKPLEVVWLCRKCHRAEHKRLKQLEVDNGNYETKKFNG